MTTLRWNTPYVDMFNRDGSTLGQGGVPPDSLVVPQIQKLADSSGMISEVQKCVNIQIFQGSAPDPAGRAYSAPQTP